MAHEDSAKGSLVRSAHNENLLDEAKKTDLCSSKYRIVQMCENEGLTENP